jgi:hypothetical protein
MVVVNRLQAESIVGRRNPLESKSREPNKAAGVSPFSSSWVGHQGSAMKVSGVSHALLPYGSLGDGLQSPLETCLALFKGISERETSVIASGRDCLNGSLKD